MLVTTELARQNQRLAVGVSVVALVIVLAAGFLSPALWLAVPLVGLLYWWIRRKTVRRLAVTDQPFPESWQKILLRDVQYFRALDEPQRDRFRKMVQVFLSEMRITGVRTDVDEQTRVLVAASAIIPVLGFDDWEYPRLGEVLIYPGRFGENYEVGGEGQRDTLGMVGVGYLSGVMILSKPDLINGFVNTTDKRNVGVHEFSHLVDNADGAVDGLPEAASGGIPQDVVRPWIQWVGEELQSPRDRQQHIDDYAYTNEAEYFAVLSEYFFESPELLQQKNPALYAMLEKMYRQNPRKLLGNVMPRKRIGRNSRCPCGSGKKFKRCCRG